MDWDWLSKNWIALLALLISGYTFLTNYWRTIRGQVNDLLNDLTSGESAKARDVVGRAARSASFKDDELEEARAAAFLLLWKIERLDVLKSNINGKSIATEESRILYRHVERIVKEINNLFEAYPGLGNFNSAVKSANEAIDNLKDVKNSWSKTVASAPEVRVHANAGQDEAVPTHPTPSGGDHKENRATTSSLAPRGAFWRRLRRGEQ